MKRVLFSFLLVAIAVSIAYGQESWSIAGDRITTRWSADVDPLNPLPEYPRPQMVRENWKNLNGLWDYAITDVNGSKPSAFDGKILVPFAVESALSGVGKTVGNKSVLWYSTKFVIPSSMKNKNILLHFGAVDWECEVFVNGQSAGSHKGGYDPFTFDITSLVKKSGQQSLEVRVFDPADNGPQPRGKQVSEPSGIWYTSVTGIWQTVWIEAVPATYIASTKQTPDIDKKQLLIDVNVVNFKQGDKVKIVAFDGASKVYETESTSLTGIVVNINNPKLWSPDNPFLYDLTITLVRNGKTTDEVKSYFAMRKSSMAKDDKGIYRLMLNNQFVFQFGPLDQGWWPDGLYTAPTDEALRFDIEKTKEMGFNMIRKHVKVEPARWYYYCDKLGMLVWQDMPSGDLGGNSWNYYIGREAGSEKIRTAESESIYRTEWNAIIDYLYNQPCIIAWVPFNEAWGQFKTVDITKWTMAKDPSRLVNPASGGNFVLTGHILDYHNYPNPIMPNVSLFGDKMALTLGEYGGLGLPLEGHTWLDKNNWGYKTFEDAETLFATYSEYIDQLVDFVAKGLSAAIYTQTTDVEIETNGLMTYDRVVVKFPEAKLKAEADKLYKAAELVK